MTGEAHFHGSEMLSETRKQRIVERVGRLLTGIDPEVRLLDVVLDSTRKQLALVMQKGEWPIVLGIDYLDYVSRRDDELRTHLAEGLQRRLEAARERETREAD